MVQIKFMVFFFRRPFRVDNKLKITKAYDSWQRTKNFCNVRQRKCIILSLFFSDLLLITMTLPSLLRLNLFLDNTRRGVNHYYYEQKKSLRSPTAYRFGVRSTPLVNNCMGRFLFTSKWNKVVLDNSYFYQVKRIQRQSYNKYIWRRVVQAKAILNHWKLVKAFIYFHKPV